MGVQFGIWNFDGKPVDPDLIARSHSLLRPFAGFMTTVLHCGALATIQSTDTTNRTPYSDRRDIQIFWNGRLDNRDELMSIASGPAGTRADSEIVQLAYEREGIKLLPRILGDWALSVIREPERELILARDFIGTKTLFYRFYGNSVAWSTVLEPLALLEKHLPPLSEEYLAGWLSFYPETGLTPYREIFSVPPASFVCVTPGRISVQKYWSLESSRPVRYRNDREYEEHFLFTFRNAVRRRANCNGRILAELSGGMDSSSIVCVADQFSDVPARERIDTVTYFDSAEPNWDELPYATTVEEKRGRTGHHIDIGPQQCLSEDRISHGFQALPMAPYARSSAAGTFDRIVAENGYCVVLSGLGGDELLGGVPTPLPELADLAACLRGIRFARQSFRWALAKKKHLLGLWRNTLAAFLPPHRKSSSLAQNWQWLTADFRARNREHLGFHPQRFRFFGPLPSLQANAAALQVLARQISCVSAPAPAGYEWRYPFLDRDLVTFCSSIPREQLVRPAQRRSLMRRALVGTVPQEILERKRKAYVSRSLVKVLAAHWRALKEEPLRVQEIGMVDRTSLSLFVDRAEQGQEIPVLPLLRTLAIERWLRELMAVPQQTDAPPLASGAAPAYALHI